MPIDKAELLRLIEEDPEVRAAVREIVATTITFEATPDSALAAAETKPSYTGRPFPGWITRLPHERAS
jgi:hypothetical protein